jgi:ketosteroid isomerase-like protein
MSTLEQNKEIVRRIFNEFWLAGNTSVLDELLAQDVVNHELSKEPVAGRTA